MSQSQHNLEENQQQKGEVQYLFVGNKAGLDNVDKEKINKIINETTQSSEFYKRQQVKRDQYDERIKEMKLIIEQTKQDHIKLLKVKKECEDKLDQIKQLVQLDRIWVHFDMDMFYVACELKDRPQLKDLPVAVGGMSMISTANYVARKFGVRSAMPGFIAKKLCPQLILIPCNFEKYRKASDQFKKVLYQYDPNLESMGLDEANLDITDYLQQNNINSDAQIYDLCHSIRNQVFESTGGLTCSCGIGPNKMLAKICSDMNKPNGQFQLINDEEKIKDFMKDLPIRKIPGIGNVTEQILKGIGIEKCSQILERVIDIKICFKDLSFDHLVSSALGIGRSWHEEETEKKSLSVSRTFQAISTIEEINEKIHQISQLLAEDAKAEQKIGKHLAVSFKNVKFQMRSKNRMLDKYIQDSEQIEKVAKELVKELLPTEPLRLIGIRLSQLADENELKNQGLSKYFAKNDKSLNNSRIQSSSKSSKKSFDNKNQNSLTTYFSNQEKNNSSLNVYQNQKIKGLLNDKNLGDVSNHQEASNFSINPNNLQKSHSNNLIQPSFLSLIDKYESEDQEDENEDSFQENNSCNKLQKQTKHQESMLNEMSYSNNQQQFQISKDNKQYINESDCESKNESEIDNRQKQEEYENDDDDDEDGDEDDDDDLIYLKKILNKNVSERLSQISEKKSQEEKRQSLSDKNNSMTPQFIQQSGGSQNQRNGSIQQKETQMIPETAHQNKQFQSQQINQTQYYQRKSEKSEISFQQQSIQSQEYMHLMMGSEESSKLDIRINRNIFPNKVQNEKENSNSMYVYDENAEYMSQQYIEHNSGSQMNNKKRVPADALTPQQVEEQLKLKKKFIPRLFECPICFLQLDSYGNATFVNNHITNCMKAQEEKFNKLEQNNSQQNTQKEEKKPVSILNNYTTKQDTKTKQSDKKNRKSDQKKQQKNSFTLDSFVIKQKN
ncbi:DNA polymerase kappa protein (macronuclear) [Tetrahymena thermophila SB210]|uniref:DNA polymerase kappa n=1 Tax=Tetrahymena thermophila (strain SB210) TaxID=312017 RepID=A4VCZ3_TETTS|nr:DNA polymerase kappa protein [Tetrahymena thermophila SB210]EDK31392.1 DNA polymerase kappa protein [Tetrahymena thermophila SB210]|eukprot:XP_001470638.1 DNA polymerase kappa protein [Tetrahymena thermophila SB210]